MYSKPHSYLLSAGHLCADMGQGALSAMLPFVIAAYGYSYAKASALVLGCGVVSSVIQPLFGWIGDRVERPWFMSLGIIIAGTGMFFLGVFSTFPLQFLCTVVMGIGVALFHPEGGSLANIVAGKDKGTGVANFNVGGNLGFVAGPLIVAAAFPHLGMHGCFLFIIPQAIVAILILTQLRRFREFRVLETNRVKAAAAASGDALEDNWPEFWKVTVVNILRSIFNRCCIVYIPLYWVAVFLASEGQGAFMVTLFTLAGAVASYFGGRIADRIGFRNTIILAGGLMTAAICAFLFAKNIAVASVLVVLIPLFMNSGSSPVVALSQSYLPRHLGSASGISLGLVVSAGAVAAPILGAAGDKWNLHVVFAIITAVSAVGFVLSLFLRNDKAATIDESCDPC
jgi:FSR family fosmidomycin resistance protein-like MFS transporter